MKLPQEVLIVGLGNGASAAQRLRAPQLCSPGIANLWYSID